MRAILTWHSLDRSGSPISVAPEEFRRQVEWLAASGVQVVAVDRLLELPEEADAAALTFDDGFANFAVEAAPVLREYGLPGTIFVVTGHVGGDNRWGARESAGIPTLPLLRWDELARLRESGMTLGAHTKSHPRLPGLDPAALEGEIAGAADEMEARLGSRPEGFAYPYGETGDAVEAVVARSFRWACTTELRALSGPSRPHNLPRIDAWYLREPARRAGWGSRQFRTWLWCRRQGRRVKSRLRKAASR
jgi:peptidoglycan/xylan/chitin deacetylase (PgdA/CDA1 family)